MEMLFVRGDGVILVSSFSLPGEFSSHNLTDIPAAAMTDMT